MTNPEPVKLCKDCKWVQQKYDTISILACLNPKYEKSKWHFRIPIQVARGEWEDKKYECGPSAKFWEPRDANTN